MGGKKHAEEPAPELPLRLEYRTPAELADNPGNWRTHPDAQAGAVSEVLADVGWAGACLFNETTGRLIDGHLRKKVAQARGDERIPVLIGRWTPEQEQKILLTLDPIAGMAQASKEHLDALMRQVTASGQETAKLVQFLAKQNKIDWQAVAAANPAITAGLPTGVVVEDEVPEPPADPIVQRGELWLLGEHRLMCGDATSPGDVGLLLAGRKPAAVITDPPYGVDYTGKTEEELPVHGDDPEALASLLEDSLQIAFDACLAGGCWYVAAPAGPQFFEFAKVLKHLGVWRQTIVWAKQTMVMGHSDYHYQHEVLFYGWKPGANHQAPPDRRQTTLWAIDRPTASREHPTMKPIALFAKAMGNSTSVGSEVYDPFLGSGTTIIAAEQLGRRAYGLEIGPEYCDVIIQRWQKLTGQHAQRESDGRFYDELVAGHALPDLTPASQAV